MAERSRRKEEKKGLDSWVMTYGDMMSLLLTFFVLLVSFSSIQESKFKEAALSLKGAFGVMSKPPTVVEQRELLVPNLSQKEREDILYEMRKLERSLLDKGLDQDVDIKLTDKGIAFRIDAPLLFETGQARLRPETMELLSSVGRFLSKFPYPLSVEGHTDSIPIHNDRFPSNWELSAARAVAVARHFQAQGVGPERIAAVGYGEYHPLATNTSPEGRTKNRRVEIFLKLDNERLSNNQLPLQEEENGNG
jgi:chemotaxis protein MotB